MDMIIGNGIHIGSINIDGRTPIVPPPELSDENTIGWFDYTKGINIDTGIYKWENQASGEDLVQSDNDKKPILNDGVYAQGVTYLTQAIDLNLSYITSIYVVLNQVTHNAYSYLFESMYGNVNMVYQDASPPDLIGYALNSGILGPESNLPLNEFGIIRYFKNQNLLAFRINNNSELSVAVGNDTNFLGISIGADKDGGSPSDVKFKEIIIRNVNDRGTQAELDIYNYLKIKYSFL